MQALLPLLAMLHVAAATPRPGAAFRRVEFVQRFDPAPGGRIELWIPTPLEDAPYQRLISREITGNATSARFVTMAKSPAPYLHAIWDGVAAPTLTLVNVVEVADRNGPAPDAADVSRYLASTRHVQTDGLVKTTADKIVGRLQDPDAKARAIYDWVVDHATRDPDVRGCGLGDVRSMLATGNLSGKCVDLNSLFVALARAAGVPAREVFGQRVATSTLAPALGKDGDNSKAQHCRAEYYSATQKGWVPVDPADVRKVILEEKLDVRSARVTELRQRLFGAWEGNWVAFNYARDFELPGYATQPINFLMYPMLATAKLRPDGVDPGEIGYKYSTRLVQ
jgi:transglutaminase-like putative cysteine protease